MTQEEKELLLKDLCARLPYNVVINCTEEDDEKTNFNCFLAPDMIKDIKSETAYWIIKPYLRPMSSMTEEKILELYKISYDTWYYDSLYYKNEEFISFRDSIQNNALCFKSSVWMSDINKVIDWLNSRHFDYRGIIEKSLAFEAPEGMYK